MRKYKHVNRKDFKVIKALLKVGMKKTAVVSATNKSYATIMQINKYKTFKDYKNRGLALKSKEQADLTKVSMGIRKETLEQKVDRILAILSDMKYKKNIFGL